MAWGVSANFASQKVCGVGGRRTAEFEKHELGSTPALVRLGTQNVHKTVKSCVGKLCLGGMRSLAIYS
jgi:hypothetical protein